MRIIIIFYLLFSLVNHSLAQSKSKKIDVVFGEEQKESKKLTLVDIIGHDYTGIYALKTKYKLLNYNNNIVIEHFDNKMNRTNSVKLSLTYKKKYKFLEAFMHIDDILYLYTSHPDKKTKKNLLFVETINKQSLLPNNDIKKIAEIDFSKSNRRNAGSFNFDYSRDSSKVLIYYELPFDKGEKKRIEVHIFDNRLNKLWEKKITFPKEDELIDIEDVEVDNMGNVHFLSLDYKDKRKSKRKGKPNYNYEIISYYSNGELRKNYPILIEGKFLTDMKIAINDEGDIICGGFYSEEGTFSIMGSYFLKVNSESKEIINKNFKEFGIDFITQNMTLKEEKKTKKKDKKGKDTELFEYALDNIVLRDDGGAVLIGEQYYIYSRTYYTTDANGNSTLHETYYYVYNDIIVISLSAQGTIDWNAKIPKKQISSNDGGFYSSYVLAVVKDKLYFVFNDNPENLYYKGKGEIANYQRRKESLVVMVEVDSKGNQNKEALFSSKDVEINIRPKVSEQISKSELVLFGQKKRTHQFAKITFDD